MLQGFYFKSFSVGKIYAKDNFFEVRYNMLPPEYRQKLANVEDVPEEPNNVSNRSGHNGLQKKT